MTQLNFQTHRRRLRSFLETNLKIDAEIAAQIGTNLTLSWNNFNDNIYRRCVNDLVALGMAVVKRSNDPNYGIKTEYVDLCTFIHSHTEDPGLNDLTYAGHIKKISIQELKSSWEISLRKRTMLRWLREPLA